MPLVGPAAQKKAADVACAAVLVLNLCCYFFGYYRSLSEEPTFFETCRKDRTNSEEMNAFPTPVV